MDRNVRQRVAEALRLPPCPLAGPIAHELNYRGGQDAAPSRDAVRAALARCMAQPGARFEELMHVYDAYTQWLNDCERMRERERVEARVQAGRREQEQRARRAEEERDRAQAAARAAAQRQRASMIAELDDESLALFIEEIDRTLRANVGKTMAECDSLCPHGVKELVRAVINAHRKQNHEAAVALLMRRVKKLMAMCINGDFQRGKSTIECIIGQINFAINSSRTVGDKCCTILVTVQRAWALALHATCKSKAARNDPDAEGEANGEEAAPINMEGLEEEVEAQMMALLPSSTALVTAMVMPRSLNDPVGLRPSYLT